MEAILHYRTKGHVEALGNTEEIVDLLAKQTPQNLIDVRPNEYELDNQCDYDEAHPSADPHINFYVITEIDHKTSDVTNLLQSAKNANVVITQEWQCGNEQYYVLQLN